MIPLYRASSLLFVSNVPLCGYVSASVVGQGNCLKKKRPLIRFGKMSEFICKDTIASKFRDQSFV